MIIQIINIMLDNQYSESARMRFALYTNANIFRRYYDHPVCRVNGTASFLRILGCDGHIKNHCSILIRRNPQLSHSLPAKEEFDFFNRSDIAELRLEEEDLALKMLKLETNEEKTKLQLRYRSV